MAKKKNVQAINYAMDKKQQLQKKHTHTAPVQESWQRQRGREEKKFLDWNNAWHEATSESGKYARPKTN